MQTVMVDPVTLPGSGTALGLFQIRQHGVYRPVRDYLSALLVMYAVRYS